MADSLLITCQACGKQANVPANLLGKKIRCKGCGEAVPVVAAKSAGKPAKAAPAKKSADTRLTTPAAARVLDEEDLDGKKPYMVEHVDEKPMCPFCAHEVEADQRVCLNCGYDLIKRRRHDSIKVYESTFGDYLMWHLPTIGCVLGIVFLISYCLFHHYWFPEYILSKGDLTELNKPGGRVNPFEEDAKWTEIQILIFYLPIEFWLFFFAGMACWRLGRFGFGRLFFHFHPPERIKEK